MFGNVDEGIETLCKGTRVEKCFLGFGDSVSVIPGFDVGVFAG